MRKDLLCLLVLFLLSATLSSAETTPRQFAYGMKLVTSGANPFGEVELPLTVYQTVLQSDLGDIRVFNAAGQEVPHTLRGPAECASESPVATAELPFFSIRGGGDQNADELAVRIAGHQGDSRIEIQTKTPADSEKAQGPSTYLIDTSYFEWPIELLELEWTGAETDFIGELRVETSDDLARWRPLTSVTLARLRYREQLLERNRVELPRHARYLRFAWAGQAPAVELAKVVVHSRSTQSPLQPARQWLPVPMTPSDNQPETLMADLGGRLPVDSMRIELAEPNSLVSLRLDSAETLDGPRTERWRGPIYRLRVQDREFSSDVAMFAPCRARYWFLLRDGEPANLRVEFGWRPDRLLFLAQGQGPFELAYGSGSVDAAAKPNVDLLKTAGAIGGGNPAPEQLQPGLPYPLGGTELLVPQPVAVPWKTVLLWTVLVAGVLLVGGMSLRLYRQLQAEPEQEDE